MYFFEQLFLLIDFFNSLFTTLIYLCCFYRFMDSLYLYKEAFLQKHLWESD